jgi:hypothetical protein
MKIPARSFIALVILAVAIGSFVDRARAHDWYPMECCHSMDCAPVANVGTITSTALGNELPALVVTTKHGTAVVPATFPRRESKDGQMHACMRPGEGGAMRLICLFVPPTM